MWLGTGDLAGAGQGEERRGWAGCGADLGPCRDSGFDILAGTPGARAHKMPECPLEMWRQRPPVAPGQCQTCLGRELSVSEERACWKGFKWL